MKKTFVALFLIILILTSCVPKATEKSPLKNIGLVPLDSRPANTQYPELLGQIMGLQIEIPTEHLDNFLTPAKTNEIWSWLENKTDSFDALILNTSTLFNGSLIETRNPQAYYSFDQKTERLQKFCQQHQKRQIIVINILPRLLPSQFTNLWPYQKELIQYAKELDRADLYQTPGPQWNKQLSTNILDDYLNIYQESEQLLRTLIQMTKEGLIDHLLIGQDDAEEYGLSNTIIRYLAEEIDNEKIYFVHGADELTMLALAKYATAESLARPRIAYSNPQHITTVFPFEADNLKKILETKLSYLGLESNNEQHALEIIHTDIADAQKTVQLIKDNDADYLGVMDIALTNKGDYRLWSFFTNPEIFKKIHGYAGWNTASNTIGTELAHFVAVQNLIASQNKQKAFEAYIKFKYIRFAEDFIYQGVIRNELNQILLEKGWDPNNLGDKKEEAQQILEELFKPYWRQLETLFLGEHSLGENKFCVKSISGFIYLPWPEPLKLKSM